MSNFLNHLTTTSFMTIMLIYVQVISGEIIASFASVLFFFVSSSSAHQIHQPYHSQLYLDNCQSHSTYCIVPLPTSFSISFSFFFLSLSFSLSIYLSLSLSPFPRYLSLYISLYLSICLTIYSLARSLALYFNISITI